MKNTKKPRKGYKLVKSLFGKYEEIPEEWEMKKINQIGEIITGNTPSTGKQEYYGDEYLWVSPSDIQQQKFIDNTNSKLSSRGFKICRMIPKYAVLVVCIGSTIGKISIASKQMSTNQQINSIICKEFDPEFVYYQILKNNKLIKNMANQVAVPILNKTDFGIIKIILPTNYEEQAKIASILSRVDALIEATQKAIEKTERLKKGLIQRLLTQGTNHTKFTKTTLGEIAKFSSGKFLPTKDHNSGNVPIYGGNGIAGYHDKELIKHNTIIFGRVGAYCGSVHLSKSKSWITDNAVFVKNLSNQITLEYLYRFLSRLDIRFLAEVSAQPKISQDILNHIKIHFPENLEEQQKIASILSGIDAYIQKNQQYKERLEKLKKGLMQKLLTGQIRVKV